MLIVLKICKVEFLIFEFVFIILELKIVDRYFKKLRNLMWN